VSDSERNELEALAEVAVDVAADAVIAEADADFADLAVDAAAELEQEDVVERAKADQVAKRNIVGRVVLFFKQVVGELNKVTKPTFAELRNYTGVVLAFVAVVMAIISLLDWLFYQGVTFVFTPTA
jgi:preprotein translocase subunit SecE